MLSALVCNILCVYWQIVYNIDVCEQLEIYGLSCDVYATLPFRLHNKYISVENYFYKCQRIEQMVNTLIWS